MTSSTDEFVPETQAELAAWIRESAARPPRAIYPAGGRTALHYGCPRTQPGETLCLSKLTRVIDYPARDMTVTVEAGIRVEELSRLLAAERQRLAVDVSESHRATLGGAAATNTSGPRRLGLGTLRDYVIGVSAVDAEGRPFKAGGRVVKNVAGYDLCKMLIGSLGTLAVITQVTLKLKPRPEAEAIVWASFDRAENVDEAVGQLLGSESRPVAMEVLDRQAASAVARSAGLDLPQDDLLLAIGVEGTPRDVQWQIDRLHTELGRSRPKSLADVQSDPAAALWTALVEYAVPADEPLTFKACLPPSKTVAMIAAAREAGVAIQSHAGNGIVIGHLPDEIATAAAARRIIDPLRAIATGCGGSLVILNCDDAWKGELSVFGPPSPAAGLMRTLKAKLDPRGVLNPGLLPL